MPPHLSQEMRERIVAWHTELGYKAPQIAQLAQCSERTVYDVLRLHREYGLVNNPHAQPRGRPRILSMADMNYISSIMAANPVLYLDEVQDSLAAVRGVDVSLATVSRALHRLALSNKSVATAALERNELLRATWQAEHGDIPMDYCVWLDSTLR